MQSLQCIQCKAFIRKTFYTITNFHNKLSKLMSSNRIYLNFNALFFQIISRYLQNDLRKRLNVTLNDIFGRMKILMLVLSVWFSSLFANKQKKTWKFWKKHKNKTWEKFDIKNLHVLAKTCCTACLIIEPTLLCRQV